MPHEQALPPELLSLTFSAIYEDIEDDEVSLLVRKSHELLDILLVCRRWNGIARQTPGLWTSVYVAHDLDASIRAQTYATLAGCLELDVILTSSSNGSSTDNCEIAFKQLLPKHSHRMRSITLPFLTPHISEALRTPLPSLVSFTCIPINGSDEHFSSGSACDVSLDTPELQTLILHNHAASFVGDNWPSLRTLESPYCSGNERWLWGLLGASQRTLENLLLGNPVEPLEMWAGDSLTPADGIAPCTSLPNLTSFDGVGSEDPDWDTLRFADMPALTSLTLFLGCLPNSEDQESPLPTFQHLQYLSLSTGSLSDNADLRYLLQSTPHITSLTLWSEELDAGERHIIESLLLNTGIPSMGPLLCRNLEEVSILGRLTPTTKIKELVDLRLPRLRKIKVEGEIWADESYLEKRALFEWLNERVELSGLRWWRD